MNNQLKELIDKYENLDWGYFVRSDLGDYKFEETKGIFSKLHENIDNILTYIRKNKLPNFHEQKVLKALSILMGINHDIRTFTELSQRPQIIDRIFNNISDIWRELSEVSAYIRFISGEDLISKTDSVNAKYSDALSIIQDIQKNKDNYAQAIKKVDQWIGKESKAVDFSVKQQRNSFSAAKLEHSDNKIWWWFVLGTGALSGAIWFIITLIHELGNEVSIGSALMRISILLITFYFVFFCFQQFTSHRKMCEIYNFKSIALDTMGVLYKSYVDDPVAKTQILEKGMSIIFSEPIVKEDNQIQQQIIEQIAEIIKNK